MNLSKAYNQYVPYKYRYLTLPVVSLLVVIILSLTIGRYLIDSIFATKGQIDDLKQKTEVLQAKDTLLSSIDKSSTQEEAQTAVTAVPTKTPGLPALTTLRALVTQHQVTVDSFTLQDSNPNNSSTQGIAKLVTMNIEVSGALDAVVGFANDVKSYTPLMKVNRVSISEGNDKITGSFTIVTAWSPLPQTIGKADDPLEPIKSNEQQILDQLKSLKVAGTGNFNGTENPSPTGRTNPFEAQ